MKRINKLLIAFILLILCSGCSINYNLEITKDTVQETIQVNDQVMNNRTKEKIYKEYNRWFPVYIDISEDTPIEYDSSIKIDGVEYHNKNIQEVSNGYYYTYKYNYPIERYNDASSIRQAYSKRKFFVESDYITINTDDNNLLCNYSYFESLKVTISVDTNIYKISYNNADEINGNKYIWNLNRNNCNDSEIVLTLDKKEITSNNQTNDNNSDKPTNNKFDISNYIMYIFCGILIILILIGDKIFKKIKSKNDNFDIDD